MNGQYQISYTDVNGIVQVYGQTGDVVGAQALFANLLSTGMRNPQIVDLSAIPPASVSDNPPHFNDC